MSQLIKKINYLHFRELASTNQKIYQLAVQNAPDCTVVWCDKQSKGKGYATNVWLSKPYENATFSLLLRQPFDPDGDLPILNMWTALQIKDFLTKWQLNAQVKWPNDIMIGGKKIAGILIENRISGSNTVFTVIGIGLNINQTDFGNLQSATSIRLENSEYLIEIESFIKEFSENFFSNLMYFKSENYASILQNYNDHLFRKDLISVFEKNEVRFNGIIRGVNNNGNLLVETDNGLIQEFRHKEISLLSLKK